jgi:hypothetical protein
MVDLKNISLNDLWYIIGLIVADGSLSKDGRHIYITSKDRQYLFSIRDALGIDVKIGKKARGEQKEKKYSYLQFGDVKFYQYLLDIGLTPCKSLTLGKIKVDSKYFIDFLRGVVDGDGNISTWIHRTNFHRQWSLRVASAAPLFIKWLKKEIEKYFDVRGKLYGYLHDGKKNNMYTLKFGKLAAKVIAGKIYYKNALCLNRKNKKKILFLRDKNKMVNYGSVLGPGAETGRQPRLKI